MEYTYTAEVDDLYVRLSDRPVARTVEVTPRCLVDVDDQGNAVRIEILTVAAGWPVSEVVRRFRLEDLHPILAELERVCAATAPVAALSS